MAGESPRESRPPRGEVREHSRFRYAFLALGFVCVGLGVLGAFLPVLPTTSFLLVALWAFSRSSRRFHDWLYLHPRFGPRLQEWKEHGTIPVKAKVMALSSMLASLGFMVFVAHTKWLVVGAAAAFMLLGAVYILSRPSRPR
jgi:uncharacterized protein